MCRGTASTAPVCSLTLKVTPVPPQMLEQTAPLHSTTTVSRMASGGTPRKPSSPAVREDQRDGLCETLPCFVGGVALLIGPRNLQAIGDVPDTVLFDNGREFVVHCSNPLTELFGVHTP